MSLICYEWLEECWAENAKTVSMCCFFGQYGMVDNKKTLTEHQRRRHSMEIRQRLSRRHHGILEGTTCLIFQFLYTCISRTLHLNMAEGRQPLKRQNPIRGSFRRVSKLS